MFASKLHVLQSPLFPIAEALLITLIYVYVYTYLCIFGLFVTYFIIF